MWLKLCLLLIYITVLFLLARLVEALTWYETGSLSRRLLDPMTLSVAKLKALLEERGVSYDTVVEKVELTQLVEGSGNVHADDLEGQEATSEEDSSVSTNFTSGAHFDEQVEDAKDSLWLVQIIAHDGPLQQSPLTDAVWKSVRKKVDKFGVRTGVLDCARDHLWCERRGWYSSRLLLALPKVYEQKASVTMHTFDGPPRKNAITGWMRVLLQEKLTRIKDSEQLRQDWLTFASGWQESQVRVLLFTDQDYIPMFFSALSVKFPGRVKFGVISNDNGLANDWSRRLLADKNVSLPSYIIVTHEGAYVYGKNIGDRLSFASMETLLKCFYPCLNDIFIFSFLLANLMSVVELFIVQGGMWRRMKQFLWCVVKMNTAVIMLWLPLIAIFQLPYLNHLPSLGLKLIRMATTSSLGEAVRRDYFFHAQHPTILVGSFLFACTIFGIVANKLTGGEYEENEEPWFNFTQMRTLTHLRSNEFFEPVSMSGYGISEGLQFFGSRIYAPMFPPAVPLHYISQLNTWPCHENAQQTCQHCCFSQGKTEDETCAVGCGTEGAGTSDLSPVLLRSDPHGTCQHADDLNELTNQPQRDADLPDPSSQVPNVVFSPNTLPSPKDSSRCGHCDMNRSSGCDSESTSKQSLDHGCSESTSKQSLDHGCSESTSKPSFDHGCSESTSKQSLDHGCKDSVCESPPMSKLCFPEGYLPCAQCVICLEEFLCGVQLCGLPCAHVFHHSCILTWLKRDHHFCPVCRWPAFQASPRLNQDHTD